MDNNQIQKLEASLETFRKECLFQFRNLDESATIREINELARQTYYVLDDFIQILKQS